MKPVDIEELERLEKAATQELWTAVRLVHADTGEPMTPEQVGEYVCAAVKNSAEESGSTEFFAITVQKPDGPADVCLVGNGPTSPSNAALITTAHNILPALIQEVRTLRAVANATVRRLESGCIETGYPDDALLDAIDEARRLRLLEEK